MNESSERLARGIARLEIGHWVYVSENWVQIKEIDKRVTQWVYRARGNRQETNFVFTNDQITDVYNLDLCPIGQFHGEGRQCKVCGHNETQNRLDRAAENLKRLSEISNLGSGFELEPTTSGIELSPAMGMEKMPGSSGSGDSV